jgi:hypothetical protein
MDWVAYGLCAFTARAMKFVLMRLESVVYVLCALTALVAAVLLLRGFTRSRAVLLLWCGLFFVAMTLENLLLFVDLVIVPEVDLELSRHTIALVGTVLLVLGLVSDDR